ncbi:glycoside hydrolase [Candidatus Synechococcus calcipolaris G9]|uniref:Glycoside hydrolase n=1 Tax=Candidatus Synechococcus calcipolaris G9 TaxID=1497997 RepID=A0ABT6EWM6_9SYNE|nr:glycoside hydrolase [Candidatus Synechococcus calcipolaris]MDG2989884.1 glycoside hydrolase [Candidatus Synechococcus calcipolaris G9]
MAYPLHVAFIWHQHQPLYKSCRSGQYLLPWVRLHGTKDYLDLIMVLAKYPRLHQTVNLVPSLILQIQDYVNGVALDPYLTAALTPVEQLTDQQRWFIIEHFFDANHRTMIDPHPRYNELYQQRQDKGATWCWQNWTLADYGDLLAWHNLAWIDPFFWQEDEIAQWFDQGKNFSLSDRQRIIAKQRHILSQILPQHRQMQDNGQIEVITTPYTHPILPLLADTDAGRVAVPQMTLPADRFQYPDDIDRHLRRSLHLYQQTFGRKPRGLWPSEQSVSPGILPKVAHHGFEWLCSDEAVLGWTTQTFFHRDERGTVQDPQHLYQPYGLKTNEGDMAIVFRDHRLSDLIGFTYSSMAPDVAAQDLIGHLEGIKIKLLSQQEDGGTALEKPWLVTIALDGENCWEFYQQDGLPFLESLYQRLSDRPEFELVTVSEYLQRFEVREQLPSDRLHSGSWIDGSFTTWIGDPVKNKAWDYLNAARQTLARHPEATEKANPAAWQALLAAEGSDWFWWFGEGHSSNQDAMFDQLFREHLAALYQALNEPIPDDLEKPLESHEVKETHPPQGYIHPIIDGKGDEQDWNFAGRITVGGARGTMHRQSLAQRLWYGVDHLNFYLRLDFQGTDLDAVKRMSGLHFFWYYPEQVLYNSPIPLAELPDQAPLNYLYHHHLKVNFLQQQVSLSQAIANYQWEDRQQGIQFCFDKCLELAIPWADLHVTPDWGLRLLGILTQDHCYREHLPEDQLLLLTAP